MQLDLQVQLHDIQIQLCIDSGIQYVVTDAAPEHTSSTLRSLHLQCAQALIGGCQDGCAGKETYARGTRDKRLMHKPAISAVEAEMELTLHGCVSTTNLRQ